MTECHVGSWDRKGQLRKSEDWVLVSNRAPTLAHELRRVDTRGQSVPRYRGQSQDLGLQAGALPPRLQPSLSQEHKVLMGESGAPGPPASDGSPLGWGVAQW